ncbi:MAG: DUF1786 domain-containing protein [Methanobacteriaceae archaeon]|jgi:uncharacterized protein (DUF1786 family)|nr:DUF1786 domain-containing protein [Candidatus Methanorudis spinitermitis]
MKVLAIDIGAGTQDILLYDNNNVIENSIKLVLPSPPVIISKTIKKANTDLYFDGNIMGGGKIKNHIINHIEKGYGVAMEKQAAKTIKDDLRVVKAIGVELVEEGSYENDSKFSKYSKITLKDVDIDELSSTIAKYDLNFSFDYIAIAVQDHGFSSKMGDRDFRFEKIREKLHVPLKVEDFGFTNVPDYFSRMKAVERSLNGLNPVIMDSKFAAVCGTCQDPNVAKLNSYVVMDIGNGHTMATSIEDGFIQGVFEHHTSRLNPRKIESLIDKLVKATLTHLEVHSDHGHGAHVINPISNLEKVVVTGPKRSIIEKTNLNFYNAVPNGDVMMTGPAGLIRTVEYLKNQNKIS